MGAPVERLTRWLAALVCLLFVASLRDVPLREPGALGPLDTPQKIGTLVVRVHAESAPLDGAEVRVFGELPGGLEELARTATRSGEARFEGLPNGSAWLLVAGLGYARLARSMALEAGDQEVEVELLPAESFEVVVVDSAQRPVQNAAVFLHGADPLPSAAYTDPTGLAVFDALGPAPYAVEIDAPGFGRKVLPELTGGDSPLFVKLEREAQLVVQLVDSSGARVPEATVLIAGGTLSLAKSALSNDEGQVTFSGLSGGFYEVRASRGSEVTEVGDGVLLAPGEHRELALHLVEGAFVEILVTDGDSLTPVAEADVALVEGGLSSFPLFGRTGLDGLVRLGPIVGGDASVSADAKGFVPTSAVFVEQGQLSVRVPLLRAGALSGRIVDERGYPVEGASLEVVGVGLDGMPIAESTLLLGLHRDHTLLAAPGPRPFLQRGELGVMPSVPGVPLASPERKSASVMPEGHGFARWASRQDGSFELKPVTPGRVQLLARHPSYVDTLAEVLTLEPGASAELTLVLRRGGTLEGRVFEGQRRPLAGARLELLTPDGAVERLAFSAPDGTFVFSGVPAEVVLAVARPEEPEILVEKLSIEVPPESRRAVEITLPSRRESIQIKVFDDRGFPMDRVEIQTASLDPSTSLTRTVFSDDSGEAVVAGALGLPLRFVAKRRGHAPLVTEVEKAPAVIALALLSEVSLEGDVHAREGWQKNAQITLLTPSGERHAKTDEAGRFRIGELARGHTRILVTHTGFAFQEQDLVLEPDSRGRFVMPTIELMRGGSVEGLVVDAQGRPVAGARVAIGRVPTYLPAGPLPPSVTQSDAAGRFTLVDLEPGEASVEAYKPGEGRQSVDDLRVTAGATRREVRIVLVPDLDPHERPSASASLAITLGEHRPASKLALLLDHVPYGGEAQRAGLLAGDELIRVDGQVVVSLEDARSRLDGPLAHDLVLELYRPKTGRYRVRVHREKLRP